MTYDADFLVPKNYSNASFAEEYLQAYTTEPTSHEAVSEVVFGEGGIENLSEPENAFVNIEVTGTDPEVDDVVTPNCDVCRILNGRTLDNIERERLNVGGQELWVATKNELFGMKHDTAEIYGDMSVNPRPQDFIDMNILASLMEEAEHTNHPNQDTHEVTALSKVLSKVFRKVLSSLRGHSRD